MRRGWWGVFFALIIAIILPAGPLRAESVRGLAARGNALYAAGKFADSAKLYAEAAAKAPDSPEILYDLGNARYRLNDFAGAAKAYEQAATLSRDPGLVGKSEFNLGDAFFRQGEAAEAKDPKKAIENYLKSISSFRAARKRDQGLQAAGRNLEIGKRRLKQAEAELKKRQEAERRGQEARQQLAKELGQMADRQEKMAGRSRDLAGKPPPEGQAASGEAAARQEGLSGQTKDMEHKLNQAGSDAQAAGQEVKQAEQAQAEAGDKLRAGQPGEAAPAQEQAAKSLRQAQERLAGQPPSSGPGKQGEGATSEPGKQEQQDGKAGVRPAPGDKGGMAAPPPQGAKPPSVSGQPAAQAGEGKGGPPLDQTAQDLLEQEQQNRLRQRQNRVGGSGYAPVDRDW